MIQLQNHPSQPLNGMGTLRFGIEPWKLPQSSESLQSALKHHEVIALDIDTQDDFMRNHATTNSRNGLYVGGAEDIIPNLARLTRLVDQSKLFRVATMDTHTSHDEEFKIFDAVSDHHCVKGTPGWRKIPETVSPHKKPVVISVDPDQQDVPTGWRLMLWVRNLLHQGNPVYLEKNTNSLLEHAVGDGDAYHMVANDKSVRLFKALHQAGKHVAIIYGVATDFCVMQAVRGLKQLGYKPIVVSDGIKEIAQRCDNIHDFDDVETLTTDQLESELHKAHLA